MRSLLYECQKFMNKHSMAYAKFGRLAVNDPRFFADLRDGREVRPSTDAKVRKFMREYEPE